ncbi:phosphate ABC transporter phosphate binding protein [Methanocella paludicola SANAE]|uniref:Phosphate ABC transporter phosphate binding protein n=1 Tax=Methanocella paludicola (strain DSM 17711 / JCM 13418 / NBRC 101707 / SANAE) TaxID=304371 RepID=D1YZT3_METPS|nr:phosphate ABC transporter substrate-binding protein [Methanocella paludicola]BAI61955.1 phosphate ABC transporter phosphate binding protein [Methanocella paludicola SANAE]
MDNKKLAITILTIAIIGASALILGCTGTTPTPTPAAGSATPAPLSGSLQVIGSTSVGPYAEELAVAFDEKNGGKTSVDVSQVGSTAGINAVLDGTAAVGMSSRELTAAETAKGLKTYEIAIDGIAVIINKDNPVSNLSTTQVREIYAGNITNWKQVGGNDAQIFVVTREPGSGTRGAFEELVMQKKANITTGAITQGSTGSVTAYLETNKNAIGYVSYGSLKDTVKAVQVDGVAPTTQSIKDRSYKIQRPFLFVTKGEPGGLAKAFIDYTLGSDGQAILAKHNLITK